jgi:RES domain-containing protein
VSPYASYVGTCWRAVLLGDEGRVLDGTERAGRYNRLGQRTLYMSGSQTGVAAAMARYGDVARTLFRLHVEAEPLVDLRDPDACAALMIDPSCAKEDWIAALDRDEEPSSWLVADQVRSTGAIGLIDGSRRAPGEWHLVLFDWNKTGKALVTVER